MCLRVRLCICICVCGMSVPQADRMLFTHEHITSEIIGVCPHAFMICTYVTV